ncbi:MAG: IS3 family transposase [Microthrixaceae bacterium]|nr:IS3 family transposase [Microthrixaceae bacterium]
MLIAEIQRLHAENYGVYGIQKMWALMKRHGWMIGRDQTARLMRVAGVRGATRARRVFTTRPDPKNHRQVRWAGRITRRTDPKEVVSQI